jgi:hypothetical protein
VPAGMYLIQLEASAESGQRVSCMTHVTLTGQR